MTREYIKYLQENIDRRNSQGYTQEDCKRDTRDHINQVRVFMMNMVMDMTRRAHKHDQSKLESPELEIFTEYTPKLKHSTYGSDEYKGFLAGMGEALQHHYAHNSHHPEHYTKHVCNGCFKEFKVMPNHCDVCMYSQFQKEPDISQMNLLDVVEMFCDWKAATMRHTDGDIMKSIELNQKRFRISEQLSDIFRNTAELFET